MTSFVNLWHPGLPPADSLIWSWDERVPQEGFVYRGLMETPLSLITMQVPELRPRPGFVTASIYYCGHTLNLPYSSYTTHTSSFSQPSILSNQKQRQATAFEHSNLFRLRHSGAFSTGLRVCLLFIFWTDCDSVVHMKLLLISFYVSYNRKLCMYVVSTGHCLQYLQIHSAAIPLLTRWTFILSKTNKQSCNRI